MIEIQTEKVFDPVKGEMRKILAISGVEGVSALPEEYQNSLGDTVSADISRNGEMSGIYCNNALSLKIRECYRETDFQTSLTCIRNAGQRLHEVRAAQKARRENWKGEETFLI